MKLVNSDWKTCIDFDEEKVQVICIENPKYYAEVVNELLHELSGNDGKFILSEKDKIYDLSKKADIILSPFLLDFENKKFQNAMTKKLVQIANEEEYAETKELSGQILEYIYKLSDYLDYDVSISDEVDISQLLKTVGMKVSKSEGELVEQIVDYMFLMKNVLGIELIIGVNFRSFISVHDLEKLYQTLLLKKIKLLLLENKVVDDKLECEKWLIIDSDLCEI